MRIAPLARSEGPSQYFGESHSARTSRLSRSTDTCGVAASPPAATAAILIPANRDRTGASGSDKAFLTSMPSVGIVGIRIATLEAVLSARQRARECARSYVYCESCDKSTYVDLMCLASIREL